MGGEDPGGAAMGGGEPTGEAAMGRDEPRGAAEGGLLPIGPPTGLPMEGGPPRGGLAPGGAVAGRGTAGAPEAGPVAGPMGAGRIGAGRMGAIPEPMNRVLLAKGPPAGGLPDTALGSGPPQLPQKASVGLFRVAHLGQMFSAIGFSCKYCPARQGGRAMG